MCPDVIVLGAGPAGLASALGAAERGLRTVLVEGAPEVGGMARSFDCDRVRVDHGSHRLHPATPPEVMTRLTDLLGDDLQQRPRRGRLRLGQRWVDFPLRAADLLRAMPPRWVASVARGAALGPLRRPDHTSYASVLRGSLGPTAYDALYAPYAEKLWGLPGESIDPEQARVRVTADTPVKVAARVLRTSAQRGRAAAVHRLGRSSAPGAGAPRGTVFRYPRRGFGQIVDALAEAARSAGAEIHTRQRIVRISSPAGEARGHGPVRVDTSDGSGWEAPQVLSTLPLPVLARLHRPVAPDDVIEAASALRFRAMVLIYLTHVGPPDRPPSAGPVRWTRYDAHYLPGPETPITRISEPANYRDSPDDPRDRTVLCAELPCTVGDASWEAEPAQLARIVHEAIARSELPPVLPPPGGEGIHVRRLPAVYPVYDHGFAPRLTRIEQWAQSLPGVTTLGRAGLFAHDNTHHALVMAQAAVAALRPGVGPHGQVGFDATAWAHARDGFRGHVVED